MYVEIVNDVLGIIATVKTACFEKLCIHGRICILFYLGVKEAFHSWVICPLNSEVCKPEKYVSLKYVSLRCMRFWIKDRSVIRHCREPESPLTLDQGERIRQV